MAAMERMQLDNDRINADVEEEVSKRIGAIKAALAKKISSSLMMRALKQSVGLLGTIRVVRQVRSWRLKTLDALKETELLDLSKIKELELTEAVHSCETITDSLEVCKGSVSVLLLGSASEL